MTARIQYPARMTDPDFDPYDLMPAALPAHPRVMLDAARLEFWRAATGAGWPKIMRERLCEKARAERFADDSPPESIRYGTVIPLRNALAWSLTGDRAYRDAALDGLRRIAANFLGWTRDEKGWRAAHASLGNFRAHVHAARAYDLLAADGLARGDQDLFQELMVSMLGLLDRAAHYHCSNHNSWALTARLALSIALGDRQVIHDSLYGCDRQGMDAAEWRCGLVHQIRHDILSDGHQWERSLGYHCYTLMAWTDLACMLRFAGVDLWHAELPALLEPEGRYMHRGYGPAGSVRSLKMAYDMPFYYMFGNGDFAMPNDSGLAHLRGIPIWGILYESAYEAYDDEKYLWLLARFREADGRRNDSSVPPSLETTHGDYDFVRLNRTDWPDGRFSLAADATIGACGRHVRGCSLFPMTGITVLRRQPERPDGAGAFLFWGPHSAGHQNAAALHLDLHAAGRRLTLTPTSRGYADAIHHRWHVQTIASNTVTLDETSMFPQADSASIWEADIFRERLTDSRDIRFDPGEAFHVARAVNTAVYPGARLDRTLVVADGWTLDVYRVSAERERQIDWCLHVVGEVERPADAAGVCLGNALGYAEFVDPWRLPAGAGPRRIAWRTPSGQTFGDLLPPADAAIVLARDPLIEGKPELGAQQARGPVTTVLVRAAAARAAFVSLWSAGDAPAANLVSRTETAEGIRIEVRESDHSLTHWWLPDDPAMPVEMR